MNWMTTAKSRVQNKKRKHDTLRMTAFNKVMLNNTSADKNFNKNLNVHNSDVTTRNISKDVLMLNNFSRKRKENDVNNPFQSTHREAKRNSMLPDPLVNLEISPIKNAIIIPEYEEVRGQEVLFFNDGELCDQLGNLLLHDNSGKKQYTPTNINQPLFITQLEQVNTNTNTTNDKNSSNSLQQYVATNTINAAVHSDLLSNEWWYKLLKLLDNSSTGIQTKILYQICQELSTRQITPPMEDTLDLSSLYSNQLQLQQQVIYRATTALSKSTPLSPQEALIALYRAVIAIGRDNPKTNIILYDAIRLVELVYKQSITQTESEITYKSYQRLKECKSNKYLATNNEIASGDDIYDNHNDIQIQPSTIFSSHNNNNNNNNNNSYISEITPQSKLVSSDNNNSNNISSTICKDWNLFSRSIATTTAVIDDLHKSIMEEASEEDLREDNNVDKLGYNTKEYPLNNNHPHEQSCLLPKNRIIQIKHPPQDVGRSEMDLNLEDLL